MWVFRTHLIGTPKAKCYRRVRQRYIDEVARGILPTHAEMEQWIQRKMSQVNEVNFSVQVPEDVAEASLVEDSMESYYREMTKGDAVQCVGTRTRKRIKCTICLQSKFTKIKLSCGHIFHRKCIDEWARWKSKCPICDSDLDTRPTEGA